FERRSADDRTAYMTTAAAQFPESLLSRLDQRAAWLPLGQPSLILCGLHHSHPPGHARMFRSAKFGAEQVIAAGLDGLKPFGRITARHHVHLRAKGREEEAVNHILRCEGELDDPASGHVQLIDFPIAL